MAVVPFPAHQRLTLKLPRFRAPSLAFVAFAASSVFLMLFADAILHERAFFDTRGLELAEKVDAPVLRQVFEGVNALTSSHGAVAAWALLLVGLLAWRQWVPAMAAFAIPFGGAINYVIGMIPDRTRPPAGEFVRTVGTDAASFPSGHVLGAVLLYGLVFVLAGRIQNAPARLAMRSLAVSVLLLVGPARLWEGAHWPSDVLGAWSLGLTMLAGLVSLYYRAERSWGGLPLIHQAPIPHNHDGAHAHALTSVVVFDGETVSKIYTPGLLPRVLYFGAFQAEFPYIRNRAALDAAVARRNLAAMLTEHWYGEARVARALGVDTIAGRLALTSAFVAGHEPTDRAAAKAFLKDLYRRFEAAGFPTWQIDPRQPRAVDNLLETDDGRFMIVDLESGLVTPIASLKAWARAIRRGLFPMFDTVAYDVTRDYVTREAAAMRAAHGDAWYADLVATLDVAEARTEDWVSREPRLIGRFVGGFWSGWNYRAWPGRVRRVTARGEAKATSVMSKAIDAWAEEGRISAREACELHAQVESAEMKAVMPHLGAHGVISLFLRFPFGSIARPAWTLGVLAIDTVRLCARTISLAQWKRSWTMHSPIVVVLSAIPGFGTFAYLASRNVRRNRLLVRAVLDHLLLKVPGGLYAKAGMRRIIARNPNAERLAVLQRGSIHQEWQVIEPAHGSAGRRLAA